MSDHEIRPRFFGDGLFRKRRRRRAWVPSTLYQFVKTREAERTVHLGPKYGAYCLSSVRAFARWGMVSQSRCPYPKRNKVEWPYTFAPDLDQIASYNRSFAHFRIRSVEDAINNLAYSPLRSFMGSMAITNQWLTPRKGLIEMPRRFDPNPTRHAVAFCGFNKPERLLKFANCWGPDWGDHGYGYLPFEYFRRYVDEAWVIMPGNKSPMPRPGLDYFSRSERFCNPVNRISEIIDIWNTDATARVAWAIVTACENHLDIEDFYIIPELQDVQIIKFLMEPIIEAAEAENFPIRYWIPHCDVVPTTENFPTVDLLLNTFGMVRSASQYRWAAARADMTSTAVAHSAGKAIT